MKTETLDFAPVWRSTLLAIVLAGATMTAFATEGPKAPASLVITKNTNTRKHKVKLFTAADARTILFSVDGTDGSRYNLFVFDLEGKLITQSAIKNHETGILPILVSGAYLYEVFIADQRVETGQLTVKQY